MSGLNDGGQAYRQWKQRMTSYRRGQYERNVNRNSHRHNRPNKFHHHGNNGRSHNGRHNHGRSYGGGHHHSRGQRPRIEASAAASSPIQTPFTALTAHAARAKPPHPPLPPTCGQDGRLIVQANGSRAPSEHTDRPGVEDQPHLHQQHLL